jgi:hypothetical protein
MRHAVHCAVRQNVKWNGGPDRSWGGDYNENLGTGVLEL